MIADPAVLLGLVRQFGQPYHGLADGASGSARVTLPNGGIHDFGLPLTSGNTRLSVRPGWTSPARDAEALIRDAVAGHQWPGWWIWGGVLPLSDGQWVWCGPDGKAWACRVDTAVGQLVFRRFGLVAAGADTTERRVDIGGATIGTAAVFENASPAGTRGCWRDFWAKKLYEVEITSGDETGPTAATATEVPLYRVLSESESRSTESIPACPPEGIALVWPAEELWASVAIEVVIEYIVQADYVGEVRSDKVVRLEATVSGTASTATSCGWTYIMEGDDPVPSPDGESTWERTEAVTWTYTYSLLSGADVVPVASIVCQRSAVIGFLSPDPDGVGGAATAGYDRSTINDTITIDGGTVWTGYRLSEHLHYAFLDGPMQYLAYDEPTLEAKVGVGTFTHSFDAATGITVEDSIYPAFADTEVDVGPPSAWTGTLTVGGSWGGASVAADVPTNNVAVIRRWVLPPTEGAAYQYAWGPVVATEAVDLAVLPGWTHYVSYHPVTQEIAVSDTPICWV